MVVVICIHNVRLIVMVTCNGFILSYYCIPGDLLCVWLVIVELCCQVNCVIAVA